MTRGAIEDHISVTLLPEQLTPFQDSTQGSPPFAVHFVSCCGEFRLENNPLRTDAGNAKKQVAGLSLYHKSTNAIILEQTIEKRCLKYAILSSMLLGGEYI
nr:Os03g0183850 [Ipomoea trifida]